MLVLGSAGVGTVKYLLIVISGREPTVFDGSAGTGHFPS